MIDIESIDQTKVQNLVNDLALLTLTNASDWSYRFFSVAGLKNPPHKDGIVFSHPSGQRFQLFRRGFRHRIRAAESRRCVFAGSFALFEP